MSSPCRHNPTCPRPSHLGHITAFSPLHAEHVVPATPAAPLISLSVVQPPSHISLVFSSFSGTSIRILFSTGPHVLDNMAIPSFVFFPFFAVHKKWRHFPSIADTLVHFEPTSEGTRIVLRFAKPPLARIPVLLHSVQGMVPSPSHNRQYIGSCPTCGLRLADVHIFPREPRRFFFFASGSAVSTKPHTRMPDVPAMSAAMSGNSEDTGCLNSRSPMKNMINALVPLSEGCRHTPQSRRDSKRASWGNKCHRSNKSCYVYLACIASNKS